MDKLLINFLIAYEIFSQLNISILYLDLLHATDTDDQWSDNCNISICESFQ